MNQINSMSVREKIRAIFLIFFSVYLLALYFTSADLWGSDLMTHSVLINNIPYGVGLFAIIYFLVPFLLANEEIKITDSKLLRDEDFYSDIFASIDLANYKLMDNKDLYKYFKYIESQRIEKQRTHELYKDELGGLYLDVNVSNEALDKVMNTESAIETAKKEELIRKIESAKHEVDSFQLKEASVELVARRRERELLRKELSFAREKWDFFNLEVDRLSEEVRNLIVEKNELRTIVRKALPFSMSVVDFEKKTMKETVNPD